MIFNTLVKLGNEVSEVAYNCCVFSHPVCAKKTSSLTALPQMTCMHQNVCGQTLYRHNHDQKYGANSSFNIVFTFKFLSHSFIGLLYITSLKVTSEIISNFGSLT